MNSFPYGGDVNDLNKMSKMANTKLEDKYTRRRSLKLNDIIYAFNDALYEIGKNPSHGTITEHFKAISLCMIITSIIGLLLYEFQ